MRVGQIAGPCLPCLMPGPLPASGTAASSAAKRSQAHGQSANAPVTEQTCDFPSPLFKSPPSAPNLPAPMLTPFMAPSRFQNNGATRWQGRDGERGFQDLTRCVRIQRAACLSQASPIAINPIVADVETTGAGHVRNGTTKDLVTGQGHGVFAHACARCRTTRLCSLSLRRRAHPPAWPSQRADGAYLAVFSMMAGARRRAAARTGHAGYDAVGIRVRTDSESPGSSEGETAPRCDSVRGPPHSRRVKLGLGYTVDH